jgi:hypothetical protein
MSNTLVFDITNARPGESQLALLREHGFEIDMSDERIRVSTPEGAVVHREARPHQFVYCVHFSNSRALVSFDGDSLVQGSE